MKIIWHMPTLRRHTCGLSRRALRLAAGLESLGHRVRFVVDRTKTDLPDGPIDRTVVFPDSTNANGGAPAMPTLQRLDIRAPRRLHWSLQMLSRRGAARDAVSQIDCRHDVFITCQPEAVTAYDRAQGHRPVIFVCGGSMLLHATHRRTANLGQFVNDRLNRQTERRAFVSADAVVFDSHHSRLIATTHFGLQPHRTQTIHAAVDPAAHRPADAPRRAALRDGLGIHGRDVVLVWTGRMVASKGLHILLRALARVRHAPLRLLLVGDGPERGALERLAADLKVSRLIHWAGAHADVRPFLQASDVFVFPSLGESLGLSAVEAAACGLPCIAWGCGPGHRNANSEWLSDRESGRLVTPGQVDEFAAAIDELAGRPEGRDAMGAAARRRAVGAFAWEQGIAELSHLIVEISGGIRSAARWAPPTAADFSPVRMPAASA